MLLGNSSVLAWVKVGVPILWTISDMMAWLLTPIANVRVWELIAAKVRSSHEVAHAKLTMAPLVTIITTLWVLSAIVACRRSFCLHMVMALT